MPSTYNAALASRLLIYVRCPTTGRTLDGIPGDDKVICNCPEALRHGGTHLVSKCKTSTVQEWMTERGYQPKKGQ